MKETCLGFIDDNDYMEFTTDMNKWINYITKMSKKYPNECKIIHTNADGSVFVHMPKEWFQPPRPPKKMNLSEEERQERAERLQKAREVNKNA